MKKLFTLAALAALAAFTTSTSHAATPADATVNLSATVESYVNVSMNSGAENLNFGTVSSNEAQNGVTKTTSASGIASTNTNALTVSIPSGSVTLNGSNGGTLTATLGLNDSDQQAGGQTSISASGSGSELLSAYNFTLNGDLTIPAGQQSGEYTGTVTVTATGGA